MMQTISYQRRRMPLTALCLLPLFMLPGYALAAAGCTGWGAQASQNVALNLPAVINLTGSSNSTGSVLASGNVSLTPLTCTDTSGNPVMNSSLSWSGGAQYDNVTRLLAPGIGLVISWGGTAGSNGNLSATNGSASTQGLNWTHLNWTLTRLPGGAVTGSSSINTTLVSISVPDPSVTSGVRTLNLQPGVNAMSLNATCALSVSNNGQVSLPSVDATDVARNGYGSSVAFSAAVTCPSGVTLSSGTTLTLSTTASDATDSTLVGNTGQAKGVAIEVLDGHGNRVSAMNGTVSQASFTGSTSQSFSARIAHVTGSTVSPGSVRGTATLTLTVN